MKKLGVFTFFFFSLFLLHAQVSPPELISYQGIARNSSGSPLNNQPIWVKISILKGTMNISGRIYEEDHQKSTNQFGLFTLEIGGGTVVNCSGCVSSLSNIAWDTDTYYLHIAISTDNGATYNTVGTQQLLSVPYALYSKRSGFATTSYSALNAPPGNVTVQSTGIVSVSPSSGSSFTVSAPSPIFTSSDNITNITGVYPNYTVTTTPTLYISGNNLSISGGNTITLPSPPTPTISIYANGIANVSPNSGNSFTIDVPSSTLTATSATTGVVSLTLSQGTASSSTNFSILPAIQNNAWSLSGNAISTSTNFLGTTTSYPLVFKTNNTEWMRISSNGEVGIWSITSTGQLLDIGPSTHSLTTRITNTLSNGIALYVNNTHTANTNPVFNSKQSNSNGINALFEGGKVGIGPSGFLPSYPLHVSHTGTFDVATGVNYTYTGSSSMGSAISVKAQSTGGSGISGGYFQVNGSSSGNAVALNGVATSSAPNNIGIDASATGTTSSGTNYGGNFYAANGLNNYGIYTSINSSNSNDAAIYAVSTGANGSAGRFSVTSGGSAAPALTVSSSSTMAPIAMFSGSGYVGISTNTPSAKLHINNNSSVTNNALQIDNGHIKTTAINLPALSSASTCSLWLTCAAPNLSSNSTDVAGSFYWTCGGCSLTSSSVYKGRLTFSKIYSTPPNVVLTVLVVSTSGPNNVPIVLTDVTTNYFDYYISGPPSGTLVVSKVLVYYMVME
jgi:hypothetical protein